MQIILERIKKFNRRHTVADGFDIPLSDITGNKAASDSFMNGWKYAYMLVTIFSLIGLSLAIMTKPTKNIESDE